MSILRTLNLWGSFVKFSHSVFALPFAMIMLVVIAGEISVTFAQVALLIVCVVAARTAAMSFNRLVDAEIDGKNPRTQGREIPSGAVSKRSAVLLVVLSSVVFVGLSAALGLHCFVLAPVVLAVLLGYSLLKRYTSACHLVLGLALALAPGGVWYALTATWSWRPVSLMCAVLTWVAGFDILYSCQDMDFDRRFGLFSIPQRFGLRGARAISAVLHLATMAALIVFGDTFKLGTAYVCGVALFSLLLISQHVAIARRGTACIDQVFFTRNGAASVGLFLFVLVDRLTRA